MALTGEAKKAYQREYKRKQTRDNCSETRVNTRETHDIDSKTRVSPKSQGDPLQKETQGETPIAWSEGPTPDTRTLTVTKGGSVLEVVVDSHGRPCTYERK